MKKIISIVLVFCMVFVFPVKVFASTDACITNNKSKLTIKDFEGLSPNESLELLLQHGLELPETYKENKELAVDTTAVIIEDLRINGTYGCPFSFTQAIELSERIYELVDVDNSNNSNQTKAVSYTLVDSTVLGSWNNTYKKYNCYQYALGYTNSAVDPGYYSTGHNFSLPLPSISSIANLVVNDLDTLGFYAYKTTTKPTSLSSWEKVICVRKCSSDYHFMKGINVNKWYHKPGKTNPLKWKYTSPGHKNWTNEYSKNGISYAPTLTYSSTIYYIRYWSKTGPGPTPQSYIVNQ